MKPVARIGDVHACPVHGANAIVSGGQSIVDGRQVARIGDACACGGVIVEGSGQSSDNGQRIAYVGCKTSCGGVITTGSATAKVQP